SSRSAASPAPAPSPPARTRARVAGAAGTRPSAASTSPVPPTAMRSSCPRATNRRSELEPAGLPVPLGGGPEPLARLDPRRPELGRDRAFRRAHPVGVGHVADPVGRELGLVPAD